MSSPTKSTPITNDSPRRKSSGGLFENLMVQKRGTDNVAYSQRRQSLEEQSAQKGAFGKMWDTVIRGAGPAAPK
ncbi:hypothetical protein AAFC00_003881 [Neodothiora populina]|uniref:Uncharacterized protein n=1 Tax=Neodothiora populina TaxID=2781224 RepID=A0ABR3PFQ6_9PEZI